MTTRPLRVGMIGTGWMAEAIAPDFELCHEVTLEAVAGRNSARAADFARRHDIPRALAVPELIEHPSVDLVYVATTHESHYDLADAALRAGKHVLVEKAFTTDCDQATRLVELARSRDLFLMEAMWMRFNPAIARALQLIQTGTIGEAHVLTASFGFAVPTNAGSRLWDPARAGGTLLDQGVYPLALADLLFGEPRRVRSDVSWLMPDGSPSLVDSDLTVLLKYDGGQKVAATTSIRTALPLTATIGGSEGWIEIGPAFWCPTSLTLHRDQETPETLIFTLEGRGYVPMLRAVANAIGQGLIEHVDCTLDSTLRVMRTIDRVRDDSILGGVNA